MPGVNNSNRSRPIDVEMGHQAGAAAQAPVPNPGRPAAADRAQPRPATLPQSGQAQGAAPPEPAAVRQSTPEDAPYMMTLFCGCMLAGVATAAGIGAGMGLAVRQDDNGHYVSKYNPGLVAFLAIGSLLAIGSIPFAWAAVLNKWPPAHRIPSPPSDARQQADSIRRSQYSNYMSQYNMYLNPSTRQ